MNREWSRTAKYLRLKVFPGADSQFELYEDDGETQEYLSGACARTPITQETFANEICLKIGPAEGKFLGMQETRAWILEFESITEPEEILIHSDGDLLSFQAQYDRAAQRLIIDLLEEMPTSWKIIIQLGVLLLPNRALAWKKSGRLPEGRQIAFRCQVDVPQTFSGASRTSRTIT
jgi:hypothetical protein